VNYISVLATHFKDSLVIGYWSLKRKICLLIVLLVLFLLPVTYHLTPATVYAEVIERIVAIVDDEAITLSEFNGAYQNALRSGVKATETLKTEILNGMINRLLLIRQAKRLGIGVIGGNEDAILKEYIEVRVSAFIRIPLAEIETFYEENKKFFEDKKFYEVKDEIELYLTEKELNRKLLGHIEELRKGSYIRIQLEEVK